MKKLLLLVLLLFSILNGSDIDQIESKIVMSMLRALSTNNTISIYTDSQKMKSVLKDNAVKFLDRCANADIVILEKSNNKNLCKNTPILTLNYDLLSVYPNSVASFFWQKGRPNIVFIKSRLEKQNIVLSSEFNDFIEENIW